MRILKSGATVAVCVILVVCQSQSSPLIAGDELRVKELRVTAIPAWREIEAALSSIDVTMRRRLWESENGLEVFSQPTTHHRLAWDSARGLALLRSDKKPQSPEGVYHCILNPKYAFEDWVADPSRIGTLRAIRASNNESGFIWEGGMPPSSANELIANDGRFVAASCRFLSLRLEVLFDTTRFEPLEVSQQQAVGVAYIRYKAKYLGKKADSLRENGTYTVDLDPASKYRLIRGELSVPEPDPRHESIDVKYDDKSDSFIPKTYHWQVDGIRPGHVTEELVEFDDPQKFNIPESEFHLEHYGFNESIAIPTSTKKQFGWFTIINGIALLGAGIWLISSRAKKTREGVDSR